MLSADDLRKRTAAILDALNAAIAAGTAERVDAQTYWREISWDGDISEWEDGRYPSERTLYRYRCDGTPTGGLHEPVEAGDKFNMYATKPELAATIYWRGDIGRPVQNDYTRRHGHEEAWRKQAEQTRSQRAKARHLE